MPRVGWLVGTRGGALVMAWSKAEERCTEIADSVVPEYRNGKRTYSCTGATAKKWQAAWEAAHLAITGEVGR